MKTLPLMTLLVACCATGTLWAAEPAPAKPAPTPATVPAKPAAAESAATKSDEDPKAKAKEEDAADEAEDKAAAGKPKPAASAADKSSPQRFVPSEQVRADFDVSFPIDI